MTKKTTDGNVIHHDFGYRAQPKDLPSVLAAVDIVHVDEEIAVVRLEVRFGGKAWVTHAMYSVNE